VSDVRRNAHGVRQRYEAPTWEAVWTATYDDLMTERGPVSNDAGATGPGLTNREAIALLMEWRAIAKQLGVAFPVYHYLASPAYGYLAPGDAFRVDDALAELPYPSEVAPYVWGWTSELAAQLDAIDRSLGARRLMPRVDDYAKQADTVASDVASDGGKCKIALPGVPPDLWPDCKDVIPPPFRDPHLPKLPSITRGVRALVILLGIAWLAREILDGEK
jgi:hypothetical protein